MVKDLNGLTSDEFLTALQKNFEVIVVIDTINVNVSGDEDGIPCYEKMSLDDAIKECGLDVLKPAVLHSFLLFISMASGCRLLLGWSRTYDDDDPIGVLDDDRLVLA